MSPLHIPPAVRAELETLARRGYPEETCGVLVGRADSGGARVERLARARNLNRERARDRYELAPDDLLAADLAARAAGLDVLGIWHSHPDHPARPSETDRAQAWEGWSYVIVSVTAAGVEDLRSWRLFEQRFQEEDCTS